LIKTDGPANKNALYLIMTSAIILQKVGITLNYDKEEMCWYDCTLPLQPKGGLSSSDFDAMEDSFHIQCQCNDELFGEDLLQCYTTCILDAKYETNVRDVVDGLTHLNVQQKADLLKVLLENQKMFDGTLRVFTLTAKYT
jgi:hypothetical protein